jgi:small-conductance mechanosensitive channel
MPPDRCDVEEIGAEVVVVDQKDLQIEIMTHQLAEMRDRLSETARQLQETSDLLSQQNEQLVILRDALRKQETSGMNVFQKASVIWKELSQDDRNALNQYGKANGVRNGWRQLIKAISNMRDRSETEFRQYLLAIMSGETLNVDVGV